MHCKSSIFCEIIVENTLLPARFLLWKQYKPNPGMLKKLPLVQVVVGPDSPRHTEHASYSQAGKFPTSAKAGKD